MKVLSLPLSPHLPCQLHRIAHPRPAPPPLVGRQVPPVVGTLDAQTLPPLLDHPVALGRGEESGVLVGLAVAAHHDGYCLAASCPWSALSIVRLTFRSGF